MKKILFLGNSYTFVNDMPAIFEKLVKAADIEVKTEMVAKSSAMLIGYLEKGNEHSDCFYSALEGENWDHIVLQGHSRLPAMDENGFASPAHELCKLVKERGIEPVFYQTWPYRDGSGKLSITNCSYVEMYQKLRDAYRRAAARDHADLVPAGDVFYRISLHYPEINLLLPDDNHPNIYGSYLVAIMFMFYFYGADTPVNYRPDEITEEEAEIIIKAIKETI
ncbi:MAG: DUF4886 domain-containing protein [Clostridia bacterium]|nr:DUF4886 domain-containing protein [Clostridia bacterium]